MADCFDGLVTVTNLNTDDFSIGGDVANSITSNVDGSTVVRGPGGLSSPDQVMTYDNASQALTLTRNDGSAPIIIDLSLLAADIFVDGASFDASTSVLTLTDNDAGTPDITVDLGALIGPSADANNILSTGADGKSFLTCPDVVACLTVEVCEVRDAFGNLLGSMVTSVS